MVEPSHPAESELFSHTLVAVIISSTTF